MRKSLSGSFLVTTCLLLAGCANYSGIVPEVKSIDVTSLKGSDPAVPYAGWPREDWWQELRDPVLTRLIDEALADSPNLQSALAKLDRAKAVAGMAESILWPQIDASLSMTRERFSEHGEFPPPYAGTTQSINDILVGAQWELDFFGKNREELKSAIGEVRATEADHQAARIRLTSDVARSYYNLARLLAQREVAEQRSRQRSELATLVERRFKAGLDTRVELEAAQGMVPENARDIASLDEQIGIARHALAALTGKGPDAMNAVVPSLPAVSPLALPQSMPANLLGHRADVVAARWRVESALHGLESTKARFYPNIDLRAFTGFSSIGLNTWLDAGSRQPGIGLAINLPIFDAGRLRSLYRSNAAVVDDSVAAYNSVLLNALRDVADQLSTLQSLEIQLSRQQAALASAWRSHDLAMQRYKAGIADRLTVLNMETNLIAQQRISVDLQARWIDGRVRLIRALGGGFDVISAPESAFSLSPEMANSKSEAQRKSYGQPS